MEATEGIDLYETFALYTGDQGEETARVSRTRYESGRVRWRCQKCNRTACRHIAMVLYKRATQQLDD